MSPNPDGVEPATQCGTRDLSSVVNSHAPLSAATHRDDLSLFGGHGRLPMRRGAWFEHGVLVDLSESRRDEYVDQWYRRHGMSGP